MAKEITGRFEETLDDLENLTKNPKQVVKAVTAARAFAKAVDALQAEFDPDEFGEATSDLYWSLIRKYFLEQAEDIEGFIDDDDVVS